MTCPSYKICNELSTGPLCTCPGIKVGTFCQYGKIFLIFLTDIKMTNLTLY